MKRVILTALCTATVEEAWTFDIPDDMPVDLSPEDLFNALMGKEESPPGVEFRGVENVEVNDEREREFRAFGVGEVPA